ncbi:hypothetical protein HDU98_009379 [Podochytrium sp. JEL0797]|nr:hypothetical protein HDU98_009379 [Podochytrium sp. JEL0797]
MGTHLDFTAPPSQPRSFGAPPSLLYSTRAPGYSLGAFAHLATQPPGPAAAALSNARSRCLNGSVALTHPRNQDEVVAVHLALFSGASPKKPDFNDNHFDPLDSDATARQLHEHPILNAKLCLVSKRTNIIDGSLTLPFQFSLPDSLPPTIVLLSTDSSGKNRLVGTSTFVFVVVTIALPDGSLETCVSGREAIIQLVDPVPQIEKLVPFDVKYHVKEITATLTTLKYHNLSPVPSGIDDSQSLFPKSYPITLKITTWNPLLRLLSASCEWFETIKSTTSSSDAQPTTTTRTLLKSDIEIEDFVSPSLGGFQHDFPSPDFSTLHPTFPSSSSSSSSSGSNPTSSSLISVDHSVVVMLTFCKVDVVEGAMAIAFRRVSPVFGWFSEDVMIDFDQLDVADSAVAIASKRVSQGSGLSSRSLFNGTRDTAHCASETTVRRIVPVVSAVSSFLVVIPNFRKELVGLWNHERETGRFHLQRLFPIDSFLDGVTCFMHSDSLLVRIEHASILVSTNSIHRAAAQRVRNH